MNRTVKSIVTALLGFMIVAAGLTAGGVWSDLEAVGSGDPMAHYFSGAMPDPGVHQTPLGADISLNGMPMEIAYFQSERTVKDLRDFYLGEFKKMKLVTAVKEIENESVVYGADKKAGQQRIVVIRRQGDQTLVFPSIVPLMAVPSFGAKPGSDIFAPEDAKGFVEISSADYGKSSRVIIYRVAKAPAETADLVRNGMKAKGWEVELLPGASNDKGYGGESGAVIQFIRAGKAATVTVTPGEEKGSSAILMNVQGGRR
ncbi:MAG: hypothetical protein WC889_18315 [Myxococcota bacterium]